MQTRQGPSWAKTMAIWTALLVVVLLLVRLLDTGPGPRLEFSEFMEHVEAGEVASVEVWNNEISVERFDGWRYQTLGVMTEELQQHLSEQGIVMAWKEPSRSGRTLLVVGVPLLLILVLFLYFLKKAGASSGMNVLELRKSKARLLDGDMGVSFADVGGCEEAKTQLGDVIDFLRHPERWTDAGVRLPRGVLLEGPPGCGKTLLARAVAGETDASFYVVSASEFVEMFVGVGAARVRDMFETAAKSPPAVIFIDELDAVGRKRGTGIGASHDEREQTLNQILVSMDGFQSTDRVVVIAATNRSDVLDPALLRPGRFDRRIQIEELTTVQRAEVLGIHTRGMELAPDVDLPGIAERCAGRSGAALESLVNEAGLLAVRRTRTGESEKVVVAAADFERALEPSIQEERRFDALDALLVESTSQLAQPTGRAVVRVTLARGEVVEGDLVWADASFVKVRRTRDDVVAVVPKCQIKTLEPLSGTQEVAEIAPDPWAGKMPGSA